MTVSFSSGLLQRAGLFEHAKKVASLHDHKILAFDFHFCAGPFSEQDTVARLYVERDQLPLLVARARASGDDLALLRLLFRGIRNDEPPAVFSSASIRRTTTRSCNGRKCMNILLYS